MGQGYTSPLPALLRSLEKRGSPLIGFLSICSPQTHCSEVQPDDSLTPMGGTISGRKEESGMTSLREQVRVQADLGLFGPKRD